eukprot:CAMPEP_0181283068 /NCGR_PEP_ID=MMETSP1097-20121128/14569_1 /TAXON_ID=35684 /ORGANISM="Pseudopedinella elastica, Strain CCMP716" /LENGTH=79 /DNA_ID=CAMNT_0023386203 /DNA_START=671 /DNA_END=907 /DNA_ORIENTATION=-
MKVMSDSFEASELGAATASEVEAAAEAEAAAAPLPRPGNESAPTAPPSAKPSVVAAPGPPLGCSLGAMRLGGSSASEGQ